MRGSVRCLMRERVVCVKNKRTIYFHLAPSTELINNAQLWGLKINYARELSVEEEGYRRKDKVRDGLQNINGEYE